MEKNNLLTKTILSPALRKQIAIALSLFSVLTIASFQSKDSNGTTNGDRSKQTYFVIISDVHLDLQASTNLDEPFPDPGQSPHLGKDSNYALVKSALADITNHFPDAAFVLLLGDMVAHGTQSKDATNVEQKLAGMFSKAFPKTSVFMVLGNNDTDTKDNEAPSADFLNAVARDWAPLIRSKPASEIFSNTFPDNGCYSVTLPLPGLPPQTLIGLNTTAFIKKRTNKTEVSANEMTWLKQELDKRKSERLWLAYHVPPGNDPFSSSDAPFELWEPNFETDFFRLMMENTNIVASFAGHTHRDEFKIFGGLKNPKGFVHIVPSISVYYNNYPAYQVFTVDSQGNLSDYITRYLPNYESFMSRNAFDRAAHAWTNEYDFNEAYHKRGYTLANLVLLLQELKTNPSRASLFSSYYGAKSSGIKNIFLPKENYWALMEVNK